MKELVVFASATLLAIAPGLAADLPAPPIVNAPVAAGSWTGFHVGLNGGYGWGATSGDNFCTTPAPAFIVEGRGCGVADPGNLKPHGGFLGAQAGYNFQSGPFVWGVEADFQWSAIKDSTSVAHLCCLPDPVPFRTGTIARSQSLDWFGTARGRAGVAVWDRGLVYATGGLIYGEQAVSKLGSFPDGITYPVSDSSTRVGWTAGGGVEYAFTPNMSARLEGLYYDMGSETLAFTNPTTRFTATTTFQYQGALVRGGVNWTFDWVGR